MKTWNTKIIAICPITNELLEYVGPLIKAPNKKLAHEYCQNNGLGYCKITDECIMTIQYTTTKKTMHNFEQNN